MKDLEEAARKTAEYLYNIDGEVPPEIYQAIGRLRQLINEEFKPEKSVSSQLIYNIMNPAIEAYIAEQTRLARRDEIKNQIKTLPAAVFIDDDRNVVENAAGAGLANYRYAIQMKLIDKLDHLSKKEKA